VNTKLYISRPKEGRDASSDQKGFTAIAELRERYCTATKEGRSRVVSIDRNCLPPIRSWTAQGGVWKQKRIFLQIRSDTPSVVTLTAMLAAVGISSHKL